MKLPLSAERRWLAAGVSLVLLASVGLLYAIIVGLVVFKGGIVGNEADEKTAFLENPEVLPWIKGSATDSETDADPANAAEETNIADMSGEEIFTMLCALCHGPEGKTTPNPMTRVPTLNHPDVLAVASDEYLRHIIAKGRSGSPMAPMGELLTDKGVNSVVEYMRSWEAEGVDPALIMASNGKVLAGREHYRNKCASCHGMNGEGGVGVALNTPDVLGQVTDHYLAETIINGRPGTAMAGWKHLDAQTLHDLLAYLRSWQGDVPVPAEDVANRVVDKTHTEKDAQGNIIYHELTGRALHVGKTQYENYCIECHGVEGKFEAGSLDHFAPTLNNKEFLEAASDGFLLATIARGRSHTPMRSFGVDTPGSKALGAQSMKDIVAYIRSWEQE